MTVPRRQRQRRGIELTLSEECHERLTSLSEELKETKSAIVEQILLEWEPEPARDEDEDDA
jgi:hypothetical protein